MSSIHELVTDITKSIADARDSVYDTVGIYLHTRIRDILIYEHEFTFHDAMKIAMRMEMEGQNIIGDDDDLRVKLDALAEEITKLMIEIASLILPPNASYQDWVTALYECAPGMTITINY